METIDTRTLEKARVVLSEIKRRYSENSNVIGFSIGYKEKDKKLLNQCSVKVYVKQKFPKILITNNQSIPESLDDVNIDVVERTFEWQKEPTDSFDPVVGGIKIANENNEGGFGTIGAVVNDNNTYENYILGNWHVMYGRRDATDGERIVQPINDDFNVIAKTEVGIFNKKVDCALAKSTGDRSMDRQIFETTPTISGYVEEVKMGTRVKKMGVNGPAVGVVSDLDFSISLPGPWSVSDSTLEDQLIISPVEGEEFNIGRGCSGALWVTDENEAKAVGLHVIGKRNEASAANHISEVINQLKDKGYEFTF